MEKWYRKSMWVCFARGSLSSSVRGVPICFHSIHWDETHTTLFYIVTYNLFKYGYTLSEYLEHLVTGIISETFSVAHKQRTPWLCCHLGETHLLLAPIWTTLMVGTNSLIPRKTFGCSVVFYLSLITIFLLHIQVSISLLQWEVCSRSCLSHFSLPILYMHL